MDGRQQNYVELRLGATDLAVPSCPGYDALTTYNAVCSACMSGHTIAFSAAMRGKISNHFHAYSARAARHQVSVHRV